MELVITLSGNNNYAIESVNVSNLQYTTLDFSSQNVRGYTFSAKVSLIRSGATDRSGGPGYVAGKPMSLLKGDSLATYTLRTDVADSVGNCKLNSSSTATTTLVFGQPFSVKCIVPDCNVQNYAINN